ncbi:MAG: GntR family transcriptional regulator [Bacteroidetes bacterium]|nr:GntR family transcriptional regulator [Bacteroidota bacterium]
MANLFQIDPSDPTPIYAKLERAIRLAIASGRLNAGDQLPTVRQLAVDLRINANTVAKVYAELERAGIVATRRGVGTFVVARRSQAASTRDRERELRMLEDRFLADAAALGYSVEEVLHHLIKRRG